MREYFTIMIKENDTSSLKLLQEKLTEGFYLNDRIEVGRSTVLTLQRTVRTEETRTRRSYDSIIEMDTEQPTLGSPIMSGGIY